MALNESQIQVPPDSTGSAVRTITVLTVGPDGTARTVRLQAVILSDPHGFPNPDLGLWQEMLAELRDINHKLTLIADELE